MWAVLTFPAGVSLAHTLDQGEAKAAESQSHPNQSPCLSPCAIRMPQHSADTEATHC